MADEIVLLHNPRCSKSNALKAALEQRGIAFTERRYLEDPLKATELKALCEKLDGDARSMVRSKEPEYAAAGLSKTSSVKELLAAIAKHPKLLERPVLVKGKSAAIGRPGPDAALSIL